MDDPYENEFECATGIHDHFTQSWAHNFVLIEYANPIRGERKSVLCSPGEEFNWIIEIIFQNLIEIHTQKRFLECCNSIDILKIFFKIFLKKIFQ